MVFIVIMVLCFDLWFGLLGGICDFMLFKLIFLCDDLVDICELLFIIMGVELLVIRFLLFRLFLLVFSLLLFLMWLMWGSFLFGLGKFCIFFVVFFKLIVVVSEW